MAGTRTLEENVDLAKQHLAPFTARTTPHLIAGEEVLSTSGETFMNSSPIDGIHLGDIASGDQTEVDAAARAAAAAFAEWQATPGQQRRRILHDIADLIVERADQISVVESVDTGQAIRFMSSAAVRGAENFRFFADRAPGASDGQSLPTEHFVNYTTRRAIGPVGVITPWNTPFMLSTWKIAPALAADLQYRAPHGSNAAPNQTVIQPRNGLMVLFPSWVPHAVQPYGGPGQRISIAFNFARRRDEQGR